MLLILNSCNITDYFIDENGVVKHKEGTVVEQKEIDEQINSNPDAAEMAKIKRPGMMSYSNMN
jgi:hypothetical protein